MPFGSSLLAEGRIFFRDIPIRLKVILIIGMAVGFAVLVAGAAVLFYEAKTFRPRSLESVRTQANILSEILIPSLVFKDSASAETDLWTLRYSRPIKAGAVYDKAGNFVVGYRKPGGPRTELPPRAQPFGAKFKPRDLSYSTGVYREDGMLIGSVWLDEELPPLYARLPQYGIMFGVLTLSFLAIAGMLAIALKQGVSEPITALAGTALSVIRKKDYGLRAKEGGRDEIGNLTRIFNQMLEMIEQRDHALSEANARNEAILNTTIDGITLADSQGRFLDVNPAGCQLLGYSRQEMLGLGIGDIDVVESPDTIEKRLREVHEKGRMRFETRLRTKDGRLLDVEIASTPFEVEGRRILSALRDVTERKRSEAALRESEERFSKAFHANPTPMSIIREKDGVILDVNESALKLLGFSREEVIGHPSLELGIITMDQRNDIRKRMEEQGSIRNQEIKLGAKSGESKDALMSMEIIDVGGEKCFLSTSSDITQSKLVEEQLRQSQKMEAIGRLAGGIAHDFNNLLTAINGYSGLALQGMDSSHPLYGFLHEILKSGERAAGLTKQLLAYSRKQVMEPKLWNLNAIVKDMEGMLKRFIGEDIQLISELKPNIGLVKVDRGQVEQIILNLALNARDAMPEGGRLMLQTENVLLQHEYTGEHFEALPGPYIVLSVRDTGVGMTPEVKARLFEPFFTTKDVSKGTGLGLSVVYGIVKQSGGSISVTSESGRGAVFRIYFPEVIRKDGSVGSSAPALESEGGGGDETILLVEDEKSVRKFARLALETRGYKVIEAENGVEALRLIDSADIPIHLLITDLVMPDMGGLALAGRVRERKPDFPVLFISGYPNHGISVEGGVEWGDSFLQKPFTPSELARKVREIINQSYKRSQ